MGTKNVQYRESVFVGYRYFDSANKPVRYPFGFGLSYTSFEYSALAVDDHGVSLRVTNTGQCGGAEIVQLYVALPTTKLVRPAKDLKGFAKVRLGAGETTTVHKDNNDYN